MLRTYDRQLIRETESELFVQGEFVLESYRQSLAATLGKGQSTLEGSAETQQARLPIDALREDAGRLAALPNVDEALPPTIPASADDLLAKGIAAAMTPVIERAATQTLAGIRILDSRGVVIATSRSELGLSLAPRVEVQAALQGNAPTPCCGFVARKSAMRRWPRRASQHRGPASSSGCRSSSAGACAAR